jgi:hypothetical protein
LLRGIYQCVAADRDLNDESIEISAQEAPVFDNLADSLPEPLDFVFENPLSVSHVSKALGFGDAQDIQNGGNS